VVASLEAVQPATGEKVTVAFADQGYTGERAADVDPSDRVSGGAGVAGVKAIAPIGSEPVTLEIAERIDAVSILGEKLVIVSAATSETITGVGRPIAVVSNVRLRYRQAPKRR